MDSLWLCTICANLVALALIAVSPRFISVLACQGFSAFAGVMTYTLYSSDWCSRSQYEAWKYGSDGVSFVLEALVLIIVLKRVQGLTALIASVTICLHLYAKLCCSFHLVPFTIPLQAADIALRNEREYLNIAVMLALVLLNYSGVDASASEETNEEA